MTRAREEIEAGLQKKGFRLRAKSKSKSQKRKDHRYYDLWVDGKLTGISTHVSTGTKYKELGEPLISKMAKQLKLSKSDFQLLIACPMTIEDYKLVLKRQRVL